MSIILPRLNAPFSIFNDLEGNLLEGGFLYYGEDNLDPQTNPIDVFFDEDGAIPAAQPIRTISGNPAYGASPVNIYIEEENYSITVLDRNRNLIYTKLHNHIDDNQADINTLQEEINILQISDTVFDTTGGPSDFNVITGLSEILTGSLIWVRFNVSADTDGATITVDALTPPGAVSINKVDETGTSIPIPQEEITQGTEVQLYYDGTNWLLVNVRDQQASQTNFGIIRSATSSEAIDGGASNLCITPETFLRRPDSVYRYTTAGSSSNILWGFVSGITYLAPINIEVYDNIGITLSSNSLILPAGSYRFQSSFSVLLRPTVFISDPVVSSFNSIGFESFLYNFTDGIAIGSSCPVICETSISITDISPIGGFGVSNFMSTRIYIDTYINIDSSKTFFIYGAIDDNSGANSVSYPSGAGAGITSIRNIINIWKLPEYPI